MTTKDFSVYLSVVRHDKESNKGWRMGQTYFNTLVDLYPEIAETYRTTRLDPFYKDERIGAFLADLYNKHVVVEQQS